MCSGSGSSVACKSSSNKLSATWTVHRPEYCMVRMRQARKRKGVIAIRWSNSLFGRGSACDSRVTTCRMESTDFLHLRAAEGMVDSCKKFSLKHHSPTVSCRLGLKS